MTAMDLKYDDWFYTIVNDENDETVGVMFRRVAGRESSVCFTGNSQAALDWASMSRAAFFEKYASRTPSKRDVGMFMSGAKHMIGIAREHKRGQSSRMFDAMQRELSSLMLREELCLMRGAL